MNIHNLINRGLGDLRDELTQKRHPLSDQGQPSSQKQAGQSQSIQLKAGVSLSLSEKVVDIRYHGAKVLSQKLSVQLGAAPERLAPKMPEFKPPSAEDVAARVLGFVEGRIRSEIANGASEEKVADLLAQARKGVATGYGEARQEIEKLGMMTDELSEDIGKGYDLITSGIDQLEDELLGTDKQSADVSLVDKTEGDSDSRNNRSVNEVDARAPDSVQRFSLGEQFSGRYERASVSITTRDGDDVTIDLQKLSASYGSVGQYSNGAGSGYQQVRSANLNAESYLYAIEGELDEDELVAIEELLAQMQSLADEFFSGDFEKAFESALELGFDGSEIASFSMNLTQATVQQVGVYEQVSGSDRSQGAGRYQPLAQFAKDFLAAAQHADAFSAPRQLMRDLFEQFGNDIAHNRQQKDLSELMGTHRQDFFNRLLENVSEA